MALSKGRLMDMEEAFAKGEVAWALDYSGCTALGNAAVRSSSAVAVLLAHGADANQTDTGGNAPLLIACLHAQQESAGLLLAAGANPNTAGEQGMTPLMWASHAGNIQMVQKLLMLGAHWDAVDDQGESAMDKALFMGRQDCARMLENFARGYGELSMVECVHIKPKKKAPAAKGKFMADKKPD